MSFYNFSIVCGFLFICYWFRQEEHKVRDHNKESYRLIMVLSPEKLVDIFIIILKVKQEFSDDCEFITMCTLKLYYTVLYHCDLAEYSDTYIMAVCFMILYKFCGEYDDVTVQNISIIVDEDYFVIKNLEMKILKIINHNLIKTLELPALF